MDAHEPSLAQTSSLAKTFAGLCLLVFAPRAHVFALFLLSGWMFLLCFWSAAPCFWAEKQLKKEKLTDVPESLLKSCLMANANYKRSMTRP